MVEISSICQEIGLYDPNMLIFTSTVEDATGFRLDYQ